MILYSTILTKLIIEIVIMFVIFFPPYPTSYMESRKLTLQVIIQNRGIIFASSPGSALIWNILNKYPNERIKLGFH